MPLEKGSLIYVNYSAKVKDTGEGIESTLQEDAKKLNIFDADRKYEPRLIGVGEGWVLTGLDEEIKKMEVGQKKQIELTPAKAFGDRDPAQLRMIPIRKFGEKAAELAVGDSVEVDNRIGIVRFIGSGRAQVDFNHRLAGKTVTYDVEIMKKLETDEDKVRALINRRFAGEGDKITFSLKAPHLEIEIPEDLFLVEGLQIIKRGISSDAFKFVTTVKDISFLENFVAKKPEAKKPEAEAPRLAATTT